MLNRSTRPNIPASWCYRRDQNSTSSKVAGAISSATGTSAAHVDWLAHRVPRGATVERTVESPFADMGEMIVNLNRNDFATASNTAKAVNALFGEGVAVAIDGTSIRVRAPQDPGQRVTFAGLLEEIDVTVDAPAAKVVINARTGSVVLNQAVTLGPCAIAHGNLSITISSTPVISQPAPFSQGQTVVAQQSDIRINQEPGNIIQMPASPQLADVVKALNTLGATPGDLLAILQAIKAAGALNAELEVI